MKVQTQGILWSWEDRGSGLLTFLEGGTSKQGAESRGRREAGCKDVQVSTLKTQEVAYNGETDIGSLPESEEIGIEL